MKSVREWPVEERPPTPALLVRDVRKAFVSPQGERIEVLKGVNLELAPAEVVAITGASGAGKSTLLHIVGGLEVADAGSVQFSSLLPEDRGQAHSEVGFVFQFHYLLADLTAVENVALPLLIDRRSRAESLRRATAALAELGLSAQLDQRIGELSGGERQRIAIARALIATPKVVLADEPSGNVDEHAGKEIGTLLVDYARSNSAAVVIATHNLGLAQLCDRVFVLEDGVLNRVDHGR